VKSIYLLLALLIFGLNALAQDIPGEFKTHFEMANTFIIIKVRLNGKEENFILDSGAPKIILNSEYYNSNSAMSNAIGISGNLSTGTFFMDELVWNNITVKAQQTMTMDLSDLEKVTKMPIKGFIGYTLLRNCEVLIDYQQKEISISRGKQLELHRSTMPRDSIPFVFHSQLAAIPVIINGDTCHLGLDCGSGNNMLQAKKFAKVPANAYEQIGQIDISGPKKSVAVPAKSVRLAEINISHTIYKDMPFYIVDTADPFQLDGLLGYPYLSSAKISIDYKNNKIYVW
jgi:hypothetical protein